MITAILSLAIAAQASASPSPFQRRRDEIDFCRAMTEEASRTAAELPRMVDRITRLEGLSVSCSLRTVTWNKTITVDRAQMDPHFLQVTQQEDWNHIICDDDPLGTMARRGWRFVTNYTYADGQQMITEAHC